MAQHAHEMSRTKQDTGLRAYAPFAVMTVIMYAVMYMFMYAMVDRWANVFNNVNQAYMAGLMTAPMVLIELVVMRHMYRNTGVNVGIAVAAVLALVLCWFGVRQQWGVGDGQFLRSMIPHHAGAILMCEQAPLERVEIRSLCEGIIRSQEQEIAQMKALLAQPQ